MTVDSARSSRRTASASSAPFAVSRCSISSAHSVLRWSLLVQLGDDLEGASLLGLELFLHAVAVRHGFVEPGAYLREFALKKADMVFTFPQEIGGARGVEKAGKLRKRRAGTDADEEIRRFRITRRAGEIGFGLARLSPVVKREGFHAVLK